MPGSNLAPGRYSLASSPKPGKSTQGTRLARIERILHDIDEKSTKGWDSIRRCLTTKMVNKKCCLSFNRDVRYQVDHILNSSENCKRGALKAKETKARRNNRSLEKRPYPILSGFVLLRKRWSRIKPKEWKLLAASSESIHRVTKSAPANAITDTKSHRLRVG